MVEAARGLLESGMSGMAVLSETRISLGRGTWKGPGVALTGGVMGTRQRAAARGQLTNSDPTPSGKKLVEALQVLLRVDDWSF
jgi:hypothetical protein